MKLGVCYYPEHWPPERWSVDARMMREAGLSIVRIAEFAWQKMEPEEGEFTFEWLDNAIETFHTEGLKVVLGTPTATPPAWLCAAHPEILPVDANGRQRRFGSRRHYCSNQPVYHEHTRRIVQAMTQRYGKHPAVIGWQTDNEFGCHDTARCYCETCAQKFRVWLKARYKTIDELNRAWGAVFWSQTYGDWDEIQPPNLTVTEANPSHALDYYRFSSDSVVTYQQVQIDVLRSTVSGSQFVTHNLMGNFTDLDYHDLSRPLDFVAWDSYPTGYKEVMQLYGPNETRPIFAHDVGDPHVMGFCHDLMRGIKNAPYWIMEQQAGNINWSTYNPGIRPGTVRLWTWHALASGADAVVYFRWRACLFAQEQHHSGLLHHDASPDVGYCDVAAMKDELETMSKIASGSMQAQVALLHDYDDLWALQLQPHNKDFAYQRHLFVYYRALQRLGIPVDIVSQDADLSQYKLVIAPTIFISNSSLACKLAEYVRDGGNILFGVRTGIKTESNLVTDQPLPGMFRDLVGATITAWHSLPPDASYELQSDLSNFASAHLWAESLKPDPDTRTLVSYTTTPFKGQAAVTDHEYGKGHVFYLGLHPRLDQAQSLLSHLAAQFKLVHLAHLPEGLIACRRGAHVILLNFTDRPLTAEVGDELVTVAGRNIQVIVR